MSVPTGVREQYLDRVLRNDKAATQPQMRQLASCHELVSMRSRDSEKAPGLFDGPHQAITNANGLVHTTLLDRFECRRSRQSLPVPGSSPPLQKGRVGEPERASGLSRIGT
jgi:hypothetical protein